MKGEIELQRLKDTLDILKVKCGSVASPSALTKTSVFDGHVARYKTLFERLHFCLAELERGVLGYKDSSDVMQIDHSIYDIERYLRLLREIIVSRNVSTYDPVEVANLWLDLDSGYIGGPAVDSTLKAEIICHLYKGGYDFIPMVQVNWSSCDNFHLHTPTLLEAFKASKMNATEHSNEECKVWFDSLSDEITVFRGCERSNVQGLSWTTELDVAKNFASPNRGMSLIDPVIVSAVISKADAFFACNERNEFEIVHDPFNCYITFIGY